MTHELKPKDRAWRCPMSWVPKTGTSAVKPATTIVAQDRAVEAIAFGLGIRSLGFYVFVTGMSGTGRLTTIKQFVERLAEGEDRPDDICFV
ncbi:MAG: AAA family ATPase, partial [Thermoanaerobaculales bacterium]|nr:AAA family ATPase [Thermoanaerobaculales bacterium]